MLCLVHQNKRKKVDNNLKTAGNFPNHQSNLQFKFFNLKFAFGNKGIRILKCIIFGLLCNKKMNIRTLRF
jgi:hypothetical protein